jgi:hypothetical protein
MGPNGSCVCNELTKKTHYNSDLQLAWLVIVLEEKFFYKKMAKK